MTGKISYSGLLKETGLLGMLEVKAFDAVDLALPFFCTTTDHLCGEEK